MDPIDISQSKFRISDLLAQGERVLYIQRVGIPPLVIPVEEKVPPGAYQKKPYFRRRLARVILSPSCQGIELFSGLAHAVAPRRGGEVIEMYYELHRVNFSLSSLRLTSRACVKVGDVP